MEITALKKAHADEKTELELDFAQTKIKLAECKTSIEDLEEFIEIQKLQISKIEQALTDKDKEITQNKLDLNSV